MNPLLIDVSKHNIVNWQEIALHDIQGMFARAVTSGRKDPAFDKHVTEAKDAGLLRGAYLMPVSSAIMPMERQAEMFLDTVAPHRLELDYVIDIELHHTVGNTASPHDIVTLAMALMVKGKEKPTIYTSASMWRAVMKGVHGYIAQSHDLWVAHYGVQKPYVSLPAGWERWTYWQYTDKGEVGSNKPLDFNQFNGTLTELKNRAYMFKIRRGFLNFRWRDNMPKPE